VPYCLISALQKLKEEKQIANLEELNPSNKSIYQIDLINASINLKGVRAQLSNDRDTAFADIKSQEINLTDTYKNHVDEYLCSVLSTVHRLPPFDFLNINGYSYLRMKPSKSEE